MPGSCSLGRKTLPPAGVEDQVLLMAVVSGEKVPQIVKKESTQLLPRAP